MQTFKPLDLCLTLEMLLFFCFVLVIHLPFALLSISQQSQQNDLWRTNRVRVQCES